MVLQTIRERLSGLLAILILGILVIPFAFVGINSYFTSDAQNLVARVNDTEITTTDFNQSFQNYRRRMQGQLGATFDPEAFDQPLIRRQHLDAMVDEELLVQTGAKLGLAIDNQRLAEEIRSLPAFQVDGVFNSDVYQSRLQSQGLSVSQFEREMRASMMLTQLPRALAQSSIATDRELEKVIALLEQKRDFTAVLFPVSEDDRSGEVDEAAIVARYEENPDDYMTEERVVINYLELDAINLEPPETPDEETLRNRFEQQEGRFISPEQRLASHILIEVSADADEATRETARQRAEELEQQIRDGADFGELAVENSGDQGSAPSGGDLGWIEPGFMVPAFEDALYELSLENPLSGPVQTGFGWHLIQLRDIQPSSGMSFEETRETLLAEYEQEQQERAFIEQADRLVDLIYEDPTTLEPAALTLGLEIQESVPFSRSGGLGVADNAEVVSTAFSDLVLLQDSVSDPIDLGENHLVMIHLKEHLLPELRELDEVREDIAGVLRAEQASELARQRAEAFREGLTSDADLAVIAAEQELEFQVLEEVNRRSVEPDFSVVMEVFALQPPSEDGDRRAVVEAADGFAVVSLSGVTDGELAEGSLLLETQYRRQLANGVAVTEAEVLMGQLRAAADIQVFEERL